MPIYIGNNLGDRLKILEPENASLKKYNDYHQVVHEIIICQIHVDSSVYKLSMKIDNYNKIVEWLDYSIGQSTVLQELDKKDLIIQSKPNTKQEEVH